MANKGTLQQTIGEICFSMGRVIEMNSIQLERL